MSYEAPLAERLRPDRLDHFLGQHHLTNSPDGQFFRLLRRKRPISVIFWGPPGCGKTTLAKIYVQHFSLEYSLPLEIVHATSAQTTEFRRIIEKAEEAPPLFRPTMLWIDEIHRLTRPQQDVLLSPLETGSLVIVATTTENPSFQLSRPLLSRLQVLILYPLEEEDLLEIIRTIETKYAPLPLTKEAKELMSSLAQGDARVLMNWCEELLGEAREQPLGMEELKTFLHKKRPGLEPTGDGRYNMISALHKAVRGSDPDASLYWLARQIVAGEDIRYIARRVIRMASEDVGLADPFALQVAMNALYAYETLGSPEGDLAVAEAVVYLALAPKSNSIYVAFGAATSDAERTTHLDVPRHLVNPVTSWMQKQGFGKGYIYEHDTPFGFSGQPFFPDKMEAKRYFHPYDRGFEAELLKRMEYFAELKKRLSDSQEQK